jgi:hypothetical protein
MGGPVEVVLGDVMRKGSRGTGSASVVGVGVWRVNGNVR